MYEFALWPFDSTSELADYSEWVTDLVRQSAQGEPSAAISFDLLGPRGTEPPMALDELRERVDEFPLDKVWQASLAVQTDDLSLALALNDHVLGNRESSVTVVGTDKDAVNSIKSRVQEEGDARIAAEQRRRAEARARAKAEADFKRQTAAVGIGDAPRSGHKAETLHEKEPGADKSAAKPTPPRHMETEPKKSLWQAFRDADNLAQILGGGIVALIIAIAVALLFGTG